MRRAAKVDDNQAGIVAALRAVGCSVTPTHTAGAGFPDLAVGFRGGNYFIEIKDGAKPPSARKLTPDQERWHAAWRGQVAVVTSVDEALRVVGVVPVEHRGVIS